MKNSRFSKTIDNKSSKKKKDKKKKKLKSSSNDSSSSNIKKQRNSSSSSRVSVKDKKENKERLTGVNRAECSDMEVFIKENVDLQGQIIEFIESQLALLDTEFLKEDDLGNFINNTKKFIEENFGKKKNLPEFFNTNLLDRFIIV